MQRYCIVIRLTLYIPCLDMNSPSVLIDVQCNDNLKVRQEDIS